METAHARRFEVFSIREYVHDKQLKTQWARVGVAFENQDGSWNLRLHALPLTNPKTGLADLHMRLPRPKEEANEADMPTADNFTPHNFTPRSDIPF